MRRSARWASWAGAALAIALLLLAAGQASSTAPLLLVFQANLHGVAIGDYHGGGEALAPLSPRVIDDANRDVMSTRVPSATAREPEPVVASPAPSQALPSATPSPLPTPTPVSATAPTGSITGTAQDSQTTVGIANALVSLNPTGLSTVTSSNGTFSFASVPADTYTLSASAPGYQTASASVTVTAGHNANLNLHLVSTVPIGSVQGVVKSGGTGKVVVGATVTLTPGVLATVTDTTGYYGFANVTPGTYTLTITAAGYQSYSQTITVASGRSVKANVSLTPV
jgi:hypothetical protein